MNYLQYLVKVKEEARERKVMIIGHLIDISRLIFHYS